MTSSPTDPQKQRGFSLAELAIVLLIMSVLLGGLMMPLSAQIDARNLADTTKTLNEARDALLGFAAANGRLPCPATASSNGIESPDGGGVCAQPWDGYLPGVTLGLAPTDNQGFVVDAWGRRIRYAVTKYSSNLFTTANGMKSNWPTLNPDLIVCTTATGITNAGTSTATCPTDKKLAYGAVAVLYSPGLNGTHGGGTDEAQNATADPLFISHEPTVATSTNGEFDDILIWLSGPILYNRMIAAGRLP